MTADSPRPATGAAIAAHRRPASSSCRSCAARRARTRSTSATLRSETGLITLDPGYGNTGACTSAITFLDGEQGILRYRGYPIEQLAEQSTFLEVAYLLIYGELPTREQLDGSSTSSRTTP